jgi:hypothetical protein
MKKELPNNYPLYETSYGTDLPLDQYYTHIFDKLPSKYSDATKKYKKGIIGYFIENGYVEHLNINIRGKRNYSIESMLVNEDLKSMVIIKTKPLIESPSIFNDGFNLTYVYNTLDNSIESVFDFSEIDNFLIEQKKIGGISLLRSDMGHLDTEEFSLSIPETNLEMNYGNEFLKIHDTIMNRLTRQNDKGIILFHGDPGTGKTSYLKYLTTIISEKEIIFIPPSMAESLSEPTIIPFLMEHKNSILIIEDAEKVISDREIGGSSAGVSNILNLTDGILGDCLNIQVIATFNMKREKIDSALLRKGRLIVEHKFTPLSIENSNKLLKYLGKEKTVDKPTSLADIYNIDEDLIKVENKQKIGF